MADYIQIICNNEAATIPDGLTIERFIEARDLNPNTVVVRCNGQVVRRGDYGSHVLTAGSTLELIRFVGGG